MGHNRDLKRFKEKFKKEKNGCWLWTAGKKGGGYGVFWLNGKLHGAHRVSLFFFKGDPLNTQLDAMHSCDNPACVNPKHIKYGTRSENMRDCSIKGRIVRVQDWRGSLNPKAKLKKGDFKKIIKAFESGYSYAEIGKMFNVTSVRIGQIVRNGGGWEIEEF